MANPTACPLCGRPPARIDGSGHSPALVYCASCRTHYATPQKNSDDLYSLAYYQNNYVSFEKDQADYFDAQLNAVGRWISSGRVLDVGFGTGLFLRQAKERGFEIHGIESSSAARTQAERTLGNGADLQVSRLTGQTYPALSFDLVTFWDSLSHVDDPRGYLSTAIAVLRPGGVLVIKAPYRPREFFQSVSRWLTGFPSLRRAILHYPMQQFHFDPEGLSSYLSSLGVQVLEKRVEAEPVTFPFRASTLWHPRGLLYALVERAYHAAHPPRGFILYAQKR